MTLKERYNNVIAAFQSENPAPKTELHYDSPFHLLLAVILSAQCTDKRVNLITPPLFEAFPDPKSLAEASEEEIFGYIRSVSYPNNKAKSLKGAAKMLVEEFNSEIPDDMDSLLRLPGVGRKTANVMLSVVFNQAAMAVDTHVFRVSERIGLTYRSKSPAHTEQTLVRHIPEHLVGKAHHWLILHGRYTCKARKPDCEVCTIAPFCRYFAKKQQL